MSRIFSLGALVLIGAIIADILIHPQGTAEAGKAISGIERPALNSVLGYAS